LILNLYFARSFLDRTFAKLATDKAVGAPGESTERAIHDWWRWRNTIRKNARTAAYLIFPSE